ncbi:uncharacterized protein [Dermacentor andersoni]|uniref:uncharacterized protein n=1 Tax=Dermacentor andersoni TaxID=34620 RepID=UPI003B3B5488
MLLPALKVFWRLASRTGDLVVNGTGGDFPALRSWWPDVLAYLYFAAGPVNLVATTRSLVPCHAPCRPAVLEVIARPAVLVARCSCVPLFCCRPCGARGQLKSGPVNLVFTTRGVVSCYAPCEPGDHLSSCALVYCYPCSRSGDADLSCIVTATSVGGSMVTDYSSQTSKSAWCLGTHPAVLVLWPSRLATSWPAVL